MLCCCCCVVLQHFDTDGSGFITQDELESALKEHGDAATLASHISEVLKDCDKDKVSQPCGLQQHTASRGVQAAAEPAVQRCGDSGCGMRLSCYFLVALPSETGAAALWHLSAHLVSRLIGRLLTQPTDLLWMCCHAGWAH